MAQLGLRDASRSFRPRVASLKQSRNRRPRIEDGIEPAHVANAVRVGKNVKQAGVEYVIEAFGPLMSFRASLNRNWTMRLRSAALRRAAAMGSSRKSKPVTAWPRAAKNRACSPVPQPASRIEPTTYRRRPGTQAGACRCPRRAAGVGATKGFAVVAQDVVREKISLSSF